ncbi:hypothetical protein CYY_001330 [Polysphondylium violaceum]|uniref:Uncharacterized protein n=1 Tax=Polysphondylium violaceum TaxID=133409 RepID=A0A8J4V827_9MYCE|nr:hypothetical protein CYY_001330 [Polysphondylium violaceum]
MNIKLILYVLFFVTLANFNPCNGQSIYALSQKSLTTMNWGFNYKTEVPLDIPFYNIHQISSISNSGFLNVITSNSSYEISLTQIDSATGTSQTIYSVPLDIDADQFTAVYYEPHLNYVNALYWVTVHNGQLQNTLQLVKIDFNNNQVQNLTTLPLGQGSFAGCYDQSINSYILVQFEGSLQLNISVYDTEDTSVPVTSNIVISPFVSNTDYVVLAAEGFVYLYATIGSSVYVYSINGSPVKAITFLYAINPNFQDPIYNIRVAYNDATSYIYLEVLSSSQSSMYQFELANMRLVEVFAQTPIVLNSLYDIFVQ